MRVVALSGGVGGARLVDGLAALLGDALTVIVNTGDDFCHLGLWISPDLDTVMYTLAGVADAERGWGLADESWQVLNSLKRYGAPTWFHLGDRDLATHLVRTQMLAEGATLTQVTQRLCAAWGLKPTVLPMCDAPRPTEIETLEGVRLDFQTWLVDRRGLDPVRAVHLVGSPEPAPGVIEAVQAADLVVIGPSNPYVSIDPILTLPGVRAAVQARPVVAVSPIVGGKAVKGPLAGMLHTIAGREPSAAAVVDHYGGLLRAAVIAPGDQAGIDIPVLATDVVMRKVPDRVRLARAVLEFSERLL